MIPNDIKKMLQSDDYELAFVCSEYESATEEVNTQIASIDKIVKSYDKNADGNWRSSFDERLGGCNQCGSGKCKCTFNCSDIYHYYDYLQINITADHIGGSY